MLSAKEILGNVQNEKAMTEEGKNILLLMFFVVVIVATIVLVWR